MLSHRSRQNVLCHVVLSIENVDVSVHRNELFFRSQT